MFEGYCILGRGPATGLSERHRQHEGPGLYTKQCLTHNESEAGVLHTPSSQVTMAGNGMDIPCVGFFLPSVPLAEFSSLQMTPVSFGSGSLFYEDSWKALICLQPLAA